MRRLDKNEVIGLEGPDEIPSQWHREADVLIVGSGYSGLAAAIEACDAGAPVLVLEKMPVYGGNSIISVGAYNCVDPERQKAQGVEDSMELHYEQTLSGGDYRADPEKVRFLVENALEGWKWLEELGIELDGPLLEVYGSLWPRAHLPKYKGKKRGAIVRGLYDRVKAKGIPLLLKHKVLQIIREKPFQGRILGLKVGYSGQTYFFRAKKAVILASGGFCADVEMRMRHDPRFDARFATSNHPGATGETLNMAAEVGAAEIGMEFIQTSGPSGPDIRFVSPPIGFVPQRKRLVTLIGMSVNRCIYIDLRGKRIIASDARRDSIAEAVMRTPEKVCICITDDEGRKYALYGETPVEVLKRSAQERPKEFFKADTIGELALQMGIRPEVLEETVAKYNSYVDSKKDPELGQMAENLVWRCRKSPFWAATGSPALHYMCGGLRTKGASTQVLDRGSKEIPGLYAAGEIVGGVHGTNRLGGNATADCIVFGRLAGKEAACLA